MNLYTVHGPSFWKCNVSILQDPIVKKNITDFFVNAKQYEISPAWWESCKIKVKEILMGCSNKQLASTDRQRIRFLEAQIQEDKLAQQDLPGAYHIEIDTLEVELRSLLDKRLEGTKVRSRVKHIDSLEKPTSFFL